MMDMHVKCALGTALYAVLLNLVVPMIVAKIPLKRNDNLGGKMLKMLDHHKDTPVSSSLIVGVVAFLACILSQKVKLF